MYGDSIDARGKPVGEDDWNTSSSPRHQPYPYSKVIAERKAWEIANGQDRWDMVSIHPGFVSGPSRSTRVDTSSVMLLREMLQGKYKSGFPKLYFGVVDVREVAQAHLHAALRDEANGRYICAGDTLSAIGIADALRKVSGGRYPKLPKKTIPKPMLYLAAPFIGFSWKYIRGNVGVPIRFDNHRIQKELGIEFRPYEQTFADQLEQMESDGLL
jgi:nucleoside-diphosphate-sugar epimerase